MIDAVVIGSGPGGLTAALTLARAGKKVVVCEQHYVPGGYCHSFVLGGYRFSPGVHYIGELAEGGMMRSIYEGLGMGADLTFCELNPDGFDHVLIGEERFDIPKGKAVFRERLVARFPHEQAGIDGYLDAISGLTDELNLLMRIKGPKDVLKMGAKAKNLRRWGWKTAGDLIDHYIKDPLLKGIVSAQCGDYGLGPSEVSAPVHAGVVNHYFGGGYYPLGGGYAIPRAYLKGLKKHGAEVMLEARVAEILLEGNKAVGVRLEDGTEIRAKHVISNADPEVTFGRLIGRDKLGWRLRRKIDKMTYAASAVSLFMATDLDLSAMGLDSGNYWIYDHADVDGISRRIKTHSIIDHQPEGMFLTATTLKDPSKLQKGHHTLEAFCLTGWDGFQAWANRPHGARGPDYDALKAQIKDKMVTRLERLVPGLGDHLTFWDLGTPLTNQFYADATQGSLYGTDKTPGQVGPFGFQVKTGFENLWMCGASTLSHGVAGATISGVQAAKGILKCRQRDLFSTDEASLQILPAEHPEEWPAKLQRKMKRRQAKIEAAQVAQVAAP